MLQVLRYSKFNIRNSIIIPALFLLLFSAAEVKAGEFPFQTPPQTVNPDAISFSSSAYKFNDSVSATVAVPQGGSYKLTVNGADPAEGNPCPDLQQGTNTINLGKYTQAGFFQVRLYQNSTSTTHPRCGEGNLLAADNFQVQATTTTTTTTTTTATANMCSLDPTSPVPVVKVDNCTSPNIATPVGPRDCICLSPAPGPTSCKPGDTINTAVGNIPICDLNEFARWFIGWAVGIGGGIAFLLIILAGFRILSSGGNPDQIKSGKEQLTAAITGLLFIIFSVFLLQLIGVDILRIPGFAVGGP